MMLDKTDMCKANDKIMHIPMLRHQVFPMLKGTLILRGQGHVKVKYSYSSL